MRPRAWFVVAMVVALAAAGCGGGSSGGSSGGGGTAAAKVVLLAARTTDRSRSVEMRLTEDISSPAGQTIHLHGSGVFDMQARIGRLRVNGVPGRTGPTSITEVMRGFVFYLRSSAFDGQLPSHKRWLKLDIGRMAAARGVDVRALANLRNDDPTQALQYLRAASSKTTTLGRETVDGVSTTHLRAIVDLNRVADVVPRAQRAAARASISRLIALAHRRTLPFDVWVDARHRIRRESFAESVPSSTGEPARLRITMDLVRFGVKVRVPVPPASETVDASKLAG